MTLEVRYDASYLIWDRAGLIATEISHLFKELKMQSAAPNHLTFIADKKYTISIELEKFSISDYSGDENADRNIPIIDSFASVVIDILRVRSIKRVGTRIISRRKARSEDFARKDAMHLLKAKFSHQKLFGIEIKNVNPSFKIEADNDDLGFILQSYVEKKELNIEFPPDFNYLNLQISDFPTFSLIVDVDFYTKGIVEKDSLDIGRWLASRQRFLNRDVDALFPKTEVVF